MNAPTFRKIAEYQYSFEAFIIKGKLESTGMEVEIRDNNTIDSDPIISNAIGGVKLFVKDEDYIKAQEILSEINKFSIDNQGKALKCPKCENEKVKLLTTIKDFKSLISFLISFLLIVIPFYTKYKYKCMNCDFEF